jgi:hypothetical protein
MDEDENQSEQYDSASRFADTLTRIGDICRGVPLTLSIEQYLKRDNGTLPRSNHLQSNNTCSFI